MSAIPADGASGAAGLPQTLRALAPGRRAQGESPRGAKPVETPPRTDMDGVNATSDRQDAARRDASRDAWPDPLLADETTPAEPPWNLEEPTAPVPPLAPPSSPRWPLADAEHEDLRGRRIDLHG